MKYTLLEKDRINYICIVVLAEIINFDSRFTTDSKGDDLFIQPYLELMLKADTPLLTIKGGVYVATKAGRNVLSDFMERYNEYLKVFDVFCAVDLGSGEFAFSKILDPMLYDEEWMEHIREERFSDVRVAVADFKGLDPIEIVFMAFLNEGVFNKHPYWGHDLTSMDIWNEIEGICNDAIDIDYLMEDGVLENIIREGSQLVLDLAKGDSEIVENNHIEESVVIETTEEEVIEYVDMPVYSYTHWEPYRDPYYVSPLWLAPIILW